MPGDKRENLRAEMVKTLLATPGEDRADDTDQFSSVPPTQRTIESRSSEKKLRSQVKKLGVFLSQTVTIYCCRYKVYTVYLYYTA